jgi:hypothetical protein
MTGEKETEAAPPPVQPAEPPADASLFAFLETPAFRRWAIWGLAAVCVGLFVTELLLPAKLHSHASSIPGKYAGISFASICLAVLAAWGFTLLRRGPGYYGDDGETLPERDDTVAHWRAEERGR